MEVTASIGSPDTRRELDVAGAVLSGSSITLPSGSQHLIPAQADEETVRQTYGSLYFVHGNYYSLKDGVFTYLDNAPIEINEISHRGQWVD